MKKKAIKPGGVLAIFCMVLLLTNTKSVVTSGREAIDLCIQTVIPSLFPFIFITKFISRNTFGKSRIFSFFEKLCKIPHGTASVFLIGALGGYPIGAQITQKLYKEKELSRFQAIRMSTFSNNPGPAFLFGVCGLLFTDKYIPMIMWIMQIFSAFIIGMIIPGYLEATPIHPKNTNKSIRIYLQESISTMACICGWIILFRILITICNIWVLSAAPTLIRLIFTGALELTNGCVGLFEISSQGLRFVICSGILSFGGLCITMQTASVLSGLDLKTYTLGKLVHCTLSLFISSILQLFLFSPEEKIIIPIWILIILIFLLALLGYILYNKINVEKRAYMQYNKENKLKEVH